MRVVPAPFIEEMAGKLQRVVFTKGRSGLNARTKVKPGNPQTGAQVLVRSYMKTYTEMWRTLSQANIAAWNSFAEGARKSNKFGNKYLMSGKNLFVSYNCENALVGNGVTITTPPTPTVPMTIGVSAIDFDSTGTPKATVTIDDDVPAASLLQVWVSPMLSAGVSNFKGKPTFIKTFAGGTTAGSLSVYSEYTTKYGSLVSGRKVAVQCYLNNSDKPTYFAKFKAGSLLAGKVK